MTIDQMRCFLVAAETLNFTEAAKRLYSSQQVVSRQIANLEKELGFRLFERTTKRVALTPQGEALLPAWEKALREIDGAVAKAEAQAQDKKNTLRVGIVDTVKAISIAKKAFIDYLESYGGKQQKVVIEHQTLPAGQLTDLLLWGDIDVIVVLSSELSEQKIEGMEVQVLKTLEEYIVFSKRHPFAQKSRITPKDMNSETLILPSGAFSHVSNVYILGALKAKKIAPDKVRFVDTIDSMELALYAGKGYAIAPDIFFENAGNSLRFRRFSMPADKQEALVAAWSKKNKSKRIREFIEYLIKQYIE
ncbi:MAG: LysR family transcriptional regulator [Clostridiales Family XIII bacterium]|jgi:DNA-binding transcriptional LysR family regulator|nr:LysR family transcriptional regulator [Clostridiales Family XIII bacterium]